MTSEENSQNGPQIMCTKKRFRPGTPSDQSLVPAMCTHVEKPEGGREIYVGVNPMPHYRAVFGEEPESISIIETARQLVQICEEAPRHELEDPTWIRIRCLGTEIERLLVEIHDRTCLARGGVALPVDVQSAFHLGSVLGLRIEQLMVLLAGLERHLIVGLRRKADAADASLRRAKALSEESDPQREYVLQEVARRLKMPRKFGKSKRQIVENLHREMKRDWSTLGLPGRLRTVSTLYKWCGDIENPHRKSRHEGAEDLENPHRKMRSPSVIPNAHKTGATLSMQ